MSAADLHRVGDCNPSDCVVCDVEDSEVEAKPLCEDCFADEDVHMIERHHGDILCEDCAINRDEEGL